MSYSVIMLLYSNTVLFPYHTFVYLFLLWIIHCESTVSHPTCVPVCSKVVSLQAAGKRLERLTLENMHLKGNRINLQYEYYCIFILQFILVNHNRSRLLFSSFRFILIKNKLFKKLKPKIIMNLRTYKVAHYTFFITSYMLFSALSCVFSFILSCAIVVHSLSIFDAFSLTHLLSDVLWIKELKTQLHRIHSDKSFMTNYSTL